METNLPDGREGYYKFYLASSISLLLAIASSCCAFILATLSWISAIIFCLIASYLALTSSAKL